MRHVPIQYVGMNVQAFVLEAIYSEAETNGTNET